MNKIRKNIIALMLSSVLLMPAGVFAAATVSVDASGDSSVSQSRLLAADGEDDTEGSVRSNLNRAAISTGLSGPEGDRDLVTVVAEVIRAFLGLIGVIVTILIIYAGYLWMTASGNAEQVAKAKKIMLQAIIGLAITVSAYFISGFVVNAVMTAAG